MKVICGRTKSHPEPQPDHFIFPFQVSILSSLLTEPEIARGTQILETVVGTQTGSSRKSPRTHLRSTPYTLLSNKGPRRTMRHRWGHTDFKDDFAIIIPG